MTQGANSKNKKNKSKSLVTNYYPNPLSKLVRTVKENKDFLTKMGIERTNAAQNIQKYIGWPKTLAFK